MSARASMFATLGQLWVRTAVLAFNLAVVLAGANLLALGALRLHADPHERLMNARGLAIGYPQLSAEDLAVLDSESTRDKRYAPFVQFEEPPSTGRFVNVTHGFRRGWNEGPWPPSPEFYSVFVFGGSTTFGYGAADADTVPSLLQDMLPSPAGRPVRTYNFGRGSYYSSQERILFQQLLAAGHVPQAAVFIDGLNDFYLADDRPALTDTLERFVDDLTERGPHPAVAWLRRWPLFELAAAFRRDLGLGRASGRPDDDAETLAGVIARYRVSKRLVEGLAASAGVVPVFVWQPVPVYEYDPAHWTLPPTPANRHVGPGYRAMAAFVAHEDLGANFVWCADIQREVAEPLYVDSCHYTPAMARRFAECIASELRVRRLFS